VALVTVTAMGQMDYCLRLVPGALAWLILGLGVACGSLAGETEETQPSVGSGDGSS
jgi:hypothetical protein